MIKVLASAKVNFCLHILGKRPDGYHELDSLVIFPEFGDEICIEPDEHLKVSFSGSFGTGLNVKKNSIVDAVHWFDDVFKTQTKLHFQITKNIPIMAGLGGGTADAAAVLHALFHHHGISPLEPSQFSQLGADVPVSFFGQSARMRGVGERVEAINHTEALHLVLVNPMVNVETRAVFASPKLEYSKAWSGNDFEEIWDQSQNDMQNAAVDISPEIAIMMEMMRNLGAKRVRMSGSGASAFAWMENEERAREFALNLQASAPKYWVQYAKVKPNAKPPNHIMR